MTRAAKVRIAVMVGSALLALGTMARIEDSTTAQIAGVGIVLFGLIASRLIFARMSR